MNCCTRIPCEAVLVICGCLGAFVTGRSAADAQPAAPESATAAEERSLVAALRSDVPLEEKVAACRRLAHVGSDQCVAALAPLLSDPQLSHPARIALEAIPHEAAGQALCDAVPHVEAMLLVGILHSLRARCEQKAVGVVGPLLHHPDENVAAAAAAALGALANEEAVRLLQEALDGAAAAVRAAVADACLEAAEAIADTGRHAEAAALYDRVREADVPAGVRLAATRGLLLLRSAGGDGLLAALVQSADEASFAMALRIGCELPAAAADLAAALDRLPPDRQARVMAVLGPSRDPAVEAALLRAAGSPHPSVRIAALEALPATGGAAALEILLKAAAEEDTEVAAAAREGLARIEGPGVDALFAERLAKAAGPQRRELLEVAGRRRIEAALPTLLEAADDAAEEIRLSAIRALGQIVPASQLPLLTRRMGSAATPAEAAALREALRAAAVRTAERDVAARHLAAHMDGAPLEVQRFLLETLGAVGGAAALEAVAAAAFDPQVEIQDAATQVLGQWQTADAAAVLLRVARQSPHERFRTRALRGLLRIVRQFDLPEAERLAYCRAAAPLVTRDEERLLLLGTLARLGSADALAMATGYLQTENLKEAAAEAAVAIGERLVTADATSVAAAMPHVRAAAVDPELQHRAAALMRQAEEAAGLR